MSPSLVETLKPTPAEEKLLTGTPNAFSGIYGPDGRLVSEPIIDKEGIVYADIDLNRCIEPKQYHDILGHYNRFDIFTLEVNRHHSNRSDSATPSRAKSRRTSRKNRSLG